MDLTSVPCQSTSLREGPRSLPAETSQQLPEFFLSAMRIVLILKEICTNALEPTQPCYRNNPGWALRLGSEDNDIN